MTASTILASLSPQHFKAGVDDLSEDAEQALVDAGYASRDASGCLTITNEGHRVRASQDIGRGMFHGVPGGSVRLDGGSAVTFRS